MNIKNTLIITLLLFYSTTILTKEYPYQPAHRFTNHEYVSGDYALQAINFFKFPANQKFNFIGGNLKNTPIIKGGLFLTSLDYKTNPKTKLMIDSKSRFYLNDSRGNKGLMVRKSIKDKNNWIQDQIIFYLYKPAANSGSKLIFDVDKFEKYLTQTWEFDNLEPKPGKPLPLNMPDINAFLLNFGFNAEQFDFSNLTPSELVEIAYLNRNRRFDIEILSNAYFYTSYSIEQWRKILGGPGGYKEYVSYKDMVAPEYGPIIQVLPMTQEDIKEVLK